MAALEAMARGIPVIASSVGALPQLIAHGKNGWLVNAEEDSGFLSAINEWHQLSDDQKSEIRHNARATIHENYSPMAIVPLVVRFYRHHYPGAF